MNASRPKTPLIRIAVLEADPLRLIGIQSLFDAEADFVLIPTSMSDVGMDHNTDLLLLSDQSGFNLFDVMANYRKTYPHLPIVVIGCGMDEDAMLKVITLGGKGYVDFAASTTDFVSAIRTVSQGSVWASRHVLSRFIERASRAWGEILPSGRNMFTDRENEVLEMLVKGHSNKEIGSALSIKERTVKAHVSKLMRKSGVLNRVALSVHAVTHLLVSPQHQNASKATLRT